jgi:hypothetical protein
VRVTVHVLLPDSIAYPDTTDASGAYAIDGIVTGNEIYVIMAGKPGCKGFYFRYDEIGSGSSSFDIVLEAEDPPPPGGGGDSAQVSGGIFGRDDPSEDLQPLSGAEVRFVSLGKEYLAVTDLEGHYSALLPLGSYSVTTSAPGYQQTASSGVAPGVGGFLYGAVLTPVLTGVQEDPLGPQRIALRGAYPNPFNPTTRFRYSVEGAGIAKLHLAIYDLLGREVALLVDAPSRAGTYDVVFDGADLPSGTYIARLSSEGAFQTARVVLIR